MEGYKYNPENGIYYPDKYASYGEFEAEVLIGWVLSRMQLLLDFKQSSARLNGDDKIQLEQTEMGILSTASSDEESVRIMGPNNRRDLITVDHLIHLLQFLQEKLTEPDLKLGASNFIEELEASTDKIYLDLSYLYPQSTLTKRAN